MNYMRKIHLGKRQLNPEELSQLENLSCNKENFRGEITKTGDDFIILLRESNLFNLFFSPLSIEEKVYIYNEKGELIKRVHTKNYNTHTSIYHPGHLFGKRIS